MRKSSLTKLQSEIKSLAADGRALNPRIQGASGRERASLRREKAEVGDRARHLLLAYAFLRGVPYAALEGTCRRLPSFDLVLRHAERHGVAPTSAEVGAWKDGVTGGPPADPAALTGAAG